MDLSKFKKKRLENLAGKQKASGSKEAGIQCNLDDDLGQEEKDKAKQKQKAKEEAESKVSCKKCVDFMLSRRCKPQKSGLFWILERLGRGMMAPPPPPPSDLDHKSRDGYQNWHTYRVPKCDIVAFRRHGNWF